MQLARHANAHVIATASARDRDFLRELGASAVIDYTTTRFEEVVHDVDVVFEAAGGYNGSSTANVGYSTKGTITAYLTDTEGQRAPASGTVTASATTEAPPNPTVSVAKGAITQAQTGSCVALSDCYHFDVKVTNFPANTKLSYSLVDSSGTFTSTSQARRAART